METITINGVEYVKRADIGLEAIRVSEWDGMHYYVVRTYSAGVFAGYLESKNGKEVVLRNARRIWYWEGACSLSLLAMEGTKKPEACKFAMPVNEILLTEVVEIIACTEKARLSIQGVPEWKA
mgnify:CR=1 FL=1